MSSRSLHFPARPARHVEYALTALGVTLREPLAAICAWAAKHA